MPIDNVLQPFNLLVQLLHLDRLAFKQILLLLSDFADLVHTLVQVLEELLPVLFLSIELPSGVLVEVLDNSAELMLGSLVVV